jgi:serine phosphatase RsbU (regulator of sigma subunit)
MKLRIPVFIKMMTPLVALIVLVLGWSGYRIYEESTQRLQTDMDTRLERLALLTASTVNTQTLRLVRLPADTDNAPYTEVRQQLEQAQVAGNLRWVGIYYREGDNFYYWVDTDSSGVGYPFFYATPAHFAAYTDQQSHPVQYADEFGAYYGFIAPIIVTNDEGQPQVMGLVEALLDEDATYLIQRATLQRVLPILIGGMLVLVVLAVLVMMMVFNRPLRRLRQGALTLADGQFGHTINLRSHDEFEDLAGAFNHMSTQLEGLYQERAERERMQRELEIAHNVQRALFPEQLPQLVGLEIAAFCRPFRETSGDFYQALMLGDGQLGIVVGDVSGKSIPAAMVMVSAHSIIRAEAFDHSSPALVLNKANTMLCGSIPPNMFVAASYARINARTLEITWANAGQIYPFLLHRIPPVDLTQYPSYLETSGDTLPLGMDALVEYHDHRLTLKSGDTVMFYTDGVIEAMNAAREMYGFERLEVLVRSLPGDLTPHALIEAVLTNVSAFIGAAEPHDDMTIVVVKLTTE